jgi:hypothetical protein
MSPAAVPSPLLPPAAPAAFVLPPADWTAIAAHALAHRWPHIPVRQLDDVAVELYRDPALRALPPTAAVALWLQPVAVDQRDLFPSEGTRSAA